MMGTKMQALRAGALVAVLGLAMPALAADPVGTWKTIDDETKKPRSLVKIYKGSDGKLHGKITKLFQGPGEPANPVCDKCNGRDKNKPIIGLGIIRGLAADDDAFSGGTILDPGSGKTYRCSLWVEGGGKKLKVRGYLGFFYRTQYWHRVK